MKRWSLHLSTIARVFEPGFRLRPFELVVQRGFPRESFKRGKNGCYCLNVFFFKLPKKRRRLVAAAMMSSGGGPKTSIKQANCSNSFSPGNRG